MSATDWTSEEQTVARTAFELGKQRSISALISTLQEQSGNLDTQESVWKLLNHLSNERYLYEGRAEFDEGNVLFVLADMIKQRLIALDDLQGLDQTKVSKVKAMSMF